MRWSVVWLLSIMAVISSSRALADVPMLIPFNGGLSHTDGSPVDSTASMTFSLHSAESGGSLLWSETQVGVEIDQGGFFVQLGSVVPIPINLVSNPELWVEFAIGGNTFSSRSRITSVLYAWEALHAGTADTADVALFALSGASSPDSAWTDDGTNVYVLGRNVGVGTGTPGTQVDIVGGSARIRSVATGNKLLEFSDNGSVAFRKYGGSGNVELWGSQNDQAIIQFDRGTDDVTIPNGDLTAQDVNANNGVNADYLSANDFRHASNISIFPDHNANESNAWLRIYPNGGAGSPVFEVAEDGDAFIAGKLTVGELCSTGPKNRAPKGKDGRIARWNAVESAACWFEYTDFAVLTSGTARVDLKPEILNFTAIDGKHPYVVEITLYGPSNGVYVTRSDDHFVVHENGKGTSSVEFSYTVKARQWDYPDTRLEPVETATTEE